MQVLALVIFFVCAFLVCVLSVPQIRFFESVIHTLKNTVLFE